MPAHWAVGVATHLALCPECRRQARGIEAVAGSLVEDLPAAPLAEGALTQVLARLDESVTEASPVPFDPVLPAPLRNELGFGSSDIPWRTLLPGVHEYRLVRDGDVRMSLLRLMPGHSVARHGHRGDEMTVVLRGGFEDGTGIFERGDLAVADDAVDHRPRARKDGPCICLIVAERPLRFTGLLGPVFNFFAG